MARIYEIFDDGSQGNAPYEGEHTMEAWQAAVGGYFEAVPLGTTHVAVWNEDARPDKFAVNHMFSAQHPVGHPIRGTVIVYERAEYGELP